jgi:hypothetical protein
MADLLENSSETISAVIIIGRYNGNITIEKAPKKFCQNIFLSKI